MPCISYFFLDKHVANTNKPSERKKIELTNKKRLLIEKINKTKKMYDSDKDYLSLFCLSSLISEPIFIIYT